MKKQFQTPTRKHGLQARMARGEAEKPRTSVTFQPSSQVYLWSTDSGRARQLIKH